MLVPIQKAGAMPPLFAVHGLKGVMNIGSSLVKAVGPQQPIYAIIPDGWTGQEPVTTAMEAMISTYVAQVRSVSPAGPVRVLGICGGCLVAIELVRALEQAGCLVGPPILIDPPPIVPGFNKQIQAIDVEQPLVAKELREQTRSSLLKRAATSEELFFAPHLADQLENAVSAGVAVQIAITRHVPKPYLGSVQLILSGRRVAAFFQPQMHWQYVLPSPRMVHVLPWDHVEIFTSGRETLMRSIKYMLDAAPPPLSFDIEEQPATPIAVS